MIEVRVDRALIAAPATEVRINGALIAPAAIRAEAARGTESDSVRALQEAARALAVRELLRQEAHRLGLAAPGDTAEEREELAMRALIEQEVAVPAAEESECRRYYDHHRDRFRQPLCYEADHILFAARREDHPTYEAALAQARAVLAEIRAEPARFPDLARRHSACRSGAAGGALGRFEATQVTPELRQALDATAPGTLCERPIEARYGVHVARLHTRTAGALVPFDTVHRRIAAMLEEASLRRGVAQYIRVLAGRAEITGVDLDGAGTPLVR